MATRSLLLLGLLLGLQGALAATIAEEYGVCPKYTVKEGDTLFDISKALGVEQAAIEAAAKACGTNTTNLQIGQELCLPGYIPSRCKFVIRTDPDRPYCQTYTVQAGDTITSVAGKFDLKEDALVELNSDYLEGGNKLPAAGQYIRLQGWDQVQCRDFNDNDRKKCQVYTVKAGDQAGVIAQLYKVDLAEMLALNNLTEATPLQLNFKLKLPKWDDTCAPEGIPAELPADTASCRVTQLKQDENLSVLAQRYGTTVVALQDANPELKDTTKLQPGTYVNIPPFPETCVGTGKVVDVPGKDTVPADYTYNGLQPSAAPAVVPPVDDVVVPEDVAAPAPAPAEEELAPAPAASPAATPVPAPAAAPVAAPVPAPVTAGASMGAAASTLLAAVLAVLAAAML